MSGLRSRPASTLKLTSYCDISHGLFTSNPGLIMADKPPTSQLRALIKSVAPKFVGADLAPVSSVRPQVQFIVTAPDADVLMLSLSPPPTSLLRSERLLIPSEALLLQWLTNDGWPAHRHGAGPSQTVRGKNVATGPVSRLQRRLLQQFLPGLIEHGLTGLVGNAEYVMTRPVAGTVLASLVPQLGEAERKSVDFQVGQLLRRISSQQSPNGKFGTAVAVLSPESAAPGMPRRRATLLDLHSRHDLWSEAFLSIMEATLRDAEDFNVSIQYAAVRGHVNCFTHFLDAVTCPRLVAIDAGEDTSTLVSPASSPQAHEKGQLCTGAQETYQQSSQSPPFGERSPFDAKGTPRSTRPPGPESMRVTGLRDWSNCIFGDPLLTSVLSRDASPEIWDRFQSPLQERLVDLADMQLQSLDDAQNAGVRRLLYECHHAVTAIVREYCRRYDDGDDREMPARKRLTQALRALDNLDDAGKEKSSLPCAEMSPAKRPKSNDDLAGSR